MPAVDWRRTDRRVVTFERIVGQASPTAPRLMRARHDPDRIMENAARAFFFSQVFKDGFFHGDMPRQYPDRPGGDHRRLDFGIMGRIEMADRRHMADILVGFLERDYVKVADRLLRRRLSARRRRPDGFVQAVRSIGEPILGLPLEDLVRPADGAAPGDGRAVPHADPAAAPAAAETMVVAGGRPDCLTRRSICGSSPSRSSRSG
ncbi:MAG: AarF/UbiB family protein [Geminicoccaceae bacterium]